MQERGRVLDVHLDRFRPSRTNQQLQWERVDARHVGVERVGQIVGFGGEGEDERSRGRLEWIADHAFGGADGIV